MSGAPETPLRFTVWVGIVALVVLAVVVDLAAPVSGGGEKNDIGRSIPTHHCEENPKIEDCSPDQSRQGPQQKEAPAQLNATMLLVSTASVLTLIYLAGIQQILAEPDPVERRKRWFQYTMLTLTILVTVLLAFLPSFIR